MEAPFVFLEIKNTRDSEESPAVMEQVFAAIGSGGGHGGLLAMLFGPKHPPKSYSFEIVAANSVIHFFVGVSQDLAPYVESQLTAQYPKLSVNYVGDYVYQFLALPHATIQLVQGNSYYLPLKTHKDVKDIDLMASVLGQLAKLPQGQAVSIQIRVSPAGSGWQHAARSVVTHGIPDPSTPGKFKSHPQARLIESKTTQVGFHTAIRMLAVSDSDEAAMGLLKQVAGTFGVYALGEGNALTLSEPSFWQKKRLENAFLTRSGDLAPTHQILGSSELASLWHPPGDLLAAIKNISWGSKLLGEPPGNLPIATENEEEKKNCNFFARTEFKNRMTPFGIKREDRRKHMYVIGKTGTGKSTMIANMAINDMRNGEGLAVIDPHGDLTDVLLDYVPAHRINDVAYLDPSDSGYPFHLNPLEVKNTALRELVASGIVSIFYKLYHFSWGPRLEYILRNAILTLLYVPQSTLLSIPELLTNDRYRDRIVDKLPDQVLKNFWTNEFNRMAPQLKSEAIMPILNKVGQFLSSQVIRNIVGSPTSTVDLEDMMNQGKIVLVNLSQGKLGEDNSALLGAMMITKIQLAAMNRVYMPEAERRDFYLYVDEFQNFATTSFVKILSEARKYRLNLILANQYIGQIDEEVQNAIFGNTGSLLAFGIGATDARPISKEFGLKYKEEELVQIGNYQTVLKLSIDNHTSSPFSAYTMPLPKARNLNREKIIRSSRERFCRKAEDIQPFVAPVSEPPDRPAPPPRPQQPPRPSAPVQPMRRSEDRPPREPRVVGIALAPQAAPRVAPMPPPQQPPRPQAPSAPLQQPRQQPVAPPQQPRPQPAPQPAHREPPRPQTREPQPRQPMVHREPPLHHPRQPGEQMPGSSRPVPQPAPVSQVPKAVEPLPGRPVPAEPVKPKAPTPAAPPPEIPKPTVSWDELMDRVKKQEQKNEEARAEAEKKLTGSSAAPSSVSAGKDKPQ